MLSPGTRLGPYEVLSPIGSGGMGEVYRASDSRLHREVAIKVSAVEFSERFEREARAVAALNHPNICTLYDVGPSYLVMELVEGPTLADRIKQGAVPLDEALAIAHQIADALEAAHEKGVVHRDLKPANIKITPDGRVKVLDFGLAKIAEDSAPGGSPESSPTMTWEPDTRSGVILGTAAYMSPEQARGKKVDKRADIWAFGVVLYEMLAGRRLNQGETVSDTLAAVLTKEPEWDRIPLTLQRLLKSCLEKDPKRRLRDVSDAWKLLDPAPVTAPRTVQRAPWLAWAAAPTFLLMAGLVAFLYFRQKPPVAERVRFQVALPASSGALNLSPDGRSLAFDVIGPEGGTLWVRTLDSLESRQVPGATDIGRPFFWSPDSRFIAFAAGGKLKKIDIAGGPAQTICDLDYSQGGIGGAWNRDGVIIFSDVPGIMRVSASGGAVTQLTVVRGGIHTFPSFLPDGRHFVYLRFPENAGAYIGSIDFKPEQQSSTRLVATGFSPFYAPSADPAWGHLLFMRDRTLMAQPFDARRLELSGEPVQVAERIGTFLLYASFSASDNGALAYRSGGMGGALSALSSPVWFDRQGKARGPAGESALYTNVTLSPDGTRAVASRLNAAGENAINGEDIWLLDLARGVSTRFTFGPRAVLAPVWSPDGSRIAFDMALDGLYVKAASGAGKAELLLKSTGPTYPDDWSRDGRFLLYSAFDPKTGYDLWVLPDPAGAPGERKPMPFAQTEFNEREGQFSPDSRWIAYVSDESGRAEVYVQPFPPVPGGGRKVQISRDGGDQPRWRRDGKELFYFAPDAKLMAVDVLATTPEFQPGIPKLLFKAPGFSVSPAGTKGMDSFNWDVTADGKRFLIKTASTPVSDPVTVVLNWTAGLKK